jgi:hypothetical protein
VDNCYMRQPLVKQGIVVVDPINNQYIGKSKICAKDADLLTTLSIILMAAPVIALRSRCLA